MLGIGQDHEQDTETERQHGYDVDGQVRPEGYFSKHRHEIQQGERRTNNCRDDVPAYNPPGTGCLAVRRNEHDEGMEAMATTMAA